MSITPARLLWGVLALLFTIPLLLGISQAIDGNEAGVTRILNATGYQDVRLTGYRMFSCSEDDMFRVGFAATSPTGESISGAVCGGPLKGHTIRLD